VVEYEQTGRHEYDTTVERSSGGGTVTVRTRMCQPPGDRTETNEPPERGEGGPAGHRGRGQGP
jgi:hypothetical protein